MIRRWMVTLGMALVGLPGITPAQEQQQAPAAPAQGYQYENDQGEMTSDEPAPQGEAGTYSEYNAADADVSVDLAAPGASVNFQTFQTALSPYGEWVDVPPYGRVWRPGNVSADWKPYYYGHWEWTDEGWLWASDEPWGWAPYHYGRWTVAPSVGWVWVPGYQWAPAWVSWRFSGAAVGWAPLLPGFSVYVNTFPDYYVSYFTFVPCHRFVGVPVHSIAYASRYVPRLFGDTRPAPPRAVFGAGMASPAWGGPARGYMEQRMGRPIHPARIVPVGSPGQIAGMRGRQGVVPVYRPEARPSMRPGPGGGTGFGYRPGPAPSAPMRGPGPGQNPAAGPAYRSGPPSYVPGHGPGRGPAPAQAPGFRGGGPGYAPGPGAPRPSYGPPNGYAPARPPGGYAPGPGRASGSSTPAPSRGFAPPPSRGGGFGPAPSGGGRAAPHVPSGGGSHGGGPGRHFR